MADSCASDEFSLSPLNLIPAPSPLKFSGNRKYAKGQFQCYLSSFLIWHSIQVHLATNHHTHTISCWHRNSHHQSDLRFRFRGQFAWYFSVLFLFWLNLFHVEKHLPTVSALWHSIHVILVYLLYFPAQFFFFPPFWGAFSLMSSSFHFPGLKLILLFHLIFCRMEFWWLEKKT